MELHAPLLNSLGLPEKTAHVYVALLALGTATIKDIAEKAELKRPTVYLHIAELMRQGLVEKYPVGKKEYFKAADPKLLERRAEDQLVAVRQLVPKLGSLQNQIAGRPQVSILEGRKGMEQIYDELLGANYIRFWSDTASVERYFQTYFLKVAEETARREIKTHEIVPDTPEARRSVRRYAVTAGKMYSARIATRPGIENDSVVYGDTVALFRLHANNLFVVVIKEPTMASSMKALFDMAWDSTKPFVGR